MGLKLDDLEDLYLTRSYTFEQLKRTKVKDFSIQLNVLLRQLSKKYEPLSPLEMEKIINTSNMECLIVRQEDRIVGLVMMTVKRDFRRSCAYIDNLVVDESHQGKHIGHNLMIRMIEIAEGMYLSHIDLTCNPDRIAANHLYRSLGFEKVGEVNGSNYYRKILR